MTKWLNMEKITSGTWYLVSVKMKKRDIFLKYLDLMIAKNHLEELILGVEKPVDSMYEDNVLVNLSNYHEAVSHLKNIDTFLNIQRKPIPLEAVNRML
ncbi:chromosome segregation ATPase [Calothrix sp. NIES-3974]|uniref:chromosome segregation ATPase n=1 Tax=Calothrix sp. NIES-3974 TaxID=2005462 RepID=UPI000B5F5180|nr:chromosome segregation ATPase [Calothrix sp. NIES-3974]BAZ07617.1 chromosome segregation ATPase-like protein [Calothrix sp. NIES-3974]